MILSIYVTADQWKVVTLRTYYKVAYTVCLPSYRPREAVLLDFVFDMVCHVLLLDGILLGLQISKSMILLVS